MALISTTGPICPNVTDTPLDNRSRVSKIVGIGNIPLAWKGMLVYCEENGLTYKVTSLKSKRNGPVEIENYYPATWVEFGSGGSTPSPTPFDIDAGDVTYSSGGTFTDGTVGKELQSLASNIGTLSTSIGSKVSGIQVTGESNIRYPVDGIVTIPAGGGGTGTITGATIGGSPVTASGGVLQFDAYPTANTMQYSGSINYGSGTIGKEVKILNGNVNDLSTRVTDLEADKPSPTPSPSTTTVNLANYATSSSSFTYDVDNKYIYNTKDTTFYQYSEEDNATTVYYGVFKVIGEDRYLRYSITNNTTFTYENTYTESTLPENAKKEFALGSVAVVKRVNGEGERWKNGTVNLFCTKQNMPLRNRCKNINFNGSTAWRVLIKSEDGNTIFVYKAKSNGNYEWEINVPRSSTANFNLLDKYFDRQPASNVSFDDSITQLGTQSNPVDNMQIAVEAIKNHCDTLLALEADWTNQVALLNRANINFGISDLQEFVASNHYEAGEYVLYNNNIYKFTSNHDGDWNDNHAARTSIVNEMILQSFGDIEHVSFKISTTAGALPSSALSELRLEVTYSDDNNILSITHQSLPSALTLSFDVDGYATFTCPMGLFYTTQIVQVSGSIVLNQYNTPQIIKRQARISWRTIGENLIATYDTNVSGIFIVDRDGVEYPSTDFVGDNATWTFNQAEAVKFKWIYFRDNNLNTNNGKFAIAIEEIIAGYQSKAFGPAMNEPYTGDEQYNGKTRTQYLYNNYSELRSTGYAVGWAMSQYSVIAGNEYQGFVPSVQQLTRILNNYQLVNSILDVIRPTSVWTGNTQRLVMSYIWSCTNSPYAHSMQYIDASGTITSTKKEAQSKVIICYSYE